MEKIIPEYIFETSWEICNKIGGIHTVISTKALSLLKDYGDKLIMIGPDTTRYSEGNVEFEEDRTLFANWRDKAAEDGFRIRIGRWKVIGKPITILVDFTPLIVKKDQIFTELYEDFGVDSLTGQWDYIEPVVFGWTVGKVIEHYSNYHLSPRHKIIAHFHEWMTGSGALYLNKYLPWIATTFTTHATIVGRSIAGHGMPLYEKIESYDADSIAADFQIAAKQSMEKQSAQNADSFTTVSDITARETHYLLHKDVDVITPNGFELDFVPQGEEFNKKREESRNKIINIVQKLYGDTLDENVLIVTISGRYEYRNKGIDVFLRTFEILAEKIGSDKQIIPLLLIPANQGGARNDLVSILNDDSKDGGLERPYLSHTLHNRDNDPVVKALEKSGFYKESGMFPLFVPCYLDGRDGIFNRNYYDVFIGSDIGVFPSYYEPWGYTPLESLAFKIPTITTNKAGFGLWIKEEEMRLVDGAVVIDRSDDNIDNLSATIAGHILNYSSAKEEQRKKARAKASELANKALWNNLIVNYFDAYHISLTKAKERYKKIRPFVKVEIPYSGSDKINNKPLWKKMIVSGKLPEELSGLEEMSKNLWWTWNFEAIQLFKSLDPDLWYRTGRNPQSLLNNIPSNRVKAATRDKVFMESYHQIYGAFKDYLNQKPPEKPTIGYFSMEYGFYDTLKIYSGGLGILAGDYLKEASDHQLNLISVGFLYHYGYFKQQLTVSGEQQAIQEAHNINNLPLTMLKDNFGNPVVVVVDLPGRSVYLKVWVLQVGRNPLYLLDADHDYNADEDRIITHQLYGGNWENRLKQEMVLGFGGVRLLKHLGYDVDVYHLNEGHAAFLNLERMRTLIAEENLSFDEALEVVRNTSLFTTHTPVPAGHDMFEEDLLRVYMRHMPDRLGVTWDQLMQIGRMRPYDTSEKFSMSVLAANTCGEINGVSELHGTVSREMFQKMYCGYFANELHISHVTNGVHYPTWTAKEWKKLHNDYFKENFHLHVHDRELWKNIYKVPDEEIWSIRQLLRKKLIDYIKDRYQDNWLKRNDSPGRIMQVLNTINHNSLTIGFARRFATYKRAHLLFSDTKRLAEIVNSVEHPVQFLFAGKAHPADKAGQDLIKHIIEVSRQPEFVGKIIFLENYDIQLAKRLVKGVDVWLNTPTRPLEASGTSGQKATMNGVLNFSVLDGWWREGYVEEGGWALKEERTFENQKYQDEIDALNIYSILENEIIPLFYRRNNDGIPVDWIKFIKNNIAKIAPEFTTHRMLGDYIENFYKPLQERSVKVKDDFFQQATEIAFWKQKIIKNWENIEIVTIDFPDTAKRSYYSGQKYHGEIVVDLKNLDPNEVGFDVVVASAADGMRKATIVYPVPYDKSAEGLHFYTIDIELKEPGMYEFGLRMYPKNDELKYKMDFNIVRWL